MTEQTRHEVVPIACHRDNYAYLVNAGGNDYVLVDPCERGPIHRALLSRAGRLIAILCTHSHADHVAGLQALREENTTVRVLAFGTRLEQCEPVFDSQVLQLGSLRAQVLHTPGHTLDSVVWRVGSSIFTGDTLFGAGCGRCFEGTTAQMYHSLSRLKSLDDDVAVYFGHEYTRQNLAFARLVEPNNQAVLNRLEALWSASSATPCTTPSSLGVEKASNPFLRCDQPSVREYARGAANTLTEHEVFGILRERKDHF